MAPRRARPGRAGERALSRRGAGPPPRPSPADRAAKIALSINPFDPASFAATAKVAVDRQLFWEFLESTQPQEVAKLKDRPNWQRLVLERLRDGQVSELDARTELDRLWSGGALAIVGTAHQVIQRSQAHDLSGELVPPARRPAQRPARS